jgi:RNA polymerase sigma factor (sigma-70 family)
MFESRRPIVPPADPPRPSSRSRRSARPPTTSSGATHKSPTRRRSRTTRPAATRRSPATVAFIASAAGRGDERAWDMLVDEFAGLVWAIVRAHRLSEADGADVAQATWLALVEHLDDLRDAKRVGAWLAATARNECLRVLRAAKRQVPTDDDFLERYEDVEVAGDLMLEQRDAALWRAFNRLPGRDQALLRLLVADPQPSYQEISAALDMPIGSIGPTRARSLKRLRAQLSREGLGSADVC